MTAPPDCETPARAFSALILSAGRSSRLGEFKPLITLGGETLLERAIRLFHEAGITDVTAVLGHRAESLIPLAERRGVRPVVNERYDEGMFSSLRLGVLALAPGCRGFFLLPVDIPLVRPETLRTLMAAFCEGSADICRPCCAGRHGHPPLIAAGLIPAIAGFDGTGGLRALLEGWRERTADVAVEDRGILFDVDTAADYERLRRELEREARESAAISRAATRSGGSSPAA